MSEMSILSNQYERLVSTTNRVNDSVILLKKKKFFNDSSILKKSVSKVNFEVNDLSDAQASLVSFLNNLLELLNNKTNTSEDVPTMVLEDYKNKIHTIPYIEKDIEDTIRLLQKNEQLPQKSLDLLDSISSVLDSERTTLFRKLRTARG